MAVLRGIVQHFHAGRRNSLKHPVVSNGIARLRNALHLGEAPACRLIDNVRIPLVRRESQNGIRCERVTRIQLKQVAEEFMSRFVVHGWTDLDGGG